MARTDSDMTQGTIWKHLIQFSIPMAVGLLFQQLYNTVDTVVVGQFVGQEAQAAVGSTGSIINTIVGFCAGLATGASVIISQRYGAHDREGLSKAVHTTIAITFLISLIATGVGLMIIPPMIAIIPRTSCIITALCLKAIFRPLKASENFFIQDPPRSFFAGQTSFFHLRDSCDHSPEDAADHGQTGRRTPF